MEEKIKEELNKAFNYWIELYRREQHFIDAQEHNAAFAGYGDYMLFNIEKFNETKWKAVVSKKLHKEKAERNSVYFIDSGLPIREEGYMHTGERGSFIYYQYSDDLKLMVSFNAKNHFPDFVRMLHFKEGRKIAYCSLSINGGSSHLTDSTPITEVVDKLSNDSNSFWWSTNYFIYNSAGGVEKELCYQNAAGVGSDYGEKVYEYDDKGLKKTSTKWSMGYVKIDYFRKPPNFKVKNFLLHLAELFYSKIIDAIKNLNVEDNISVLKIFYQTIGNYWPYITYATQQEAKIYSESNPGTDYFFWLTDTNSEIKIQTDNVLDEQFSILENLTDTNYRFHYGEKMWRVVARKLNTTFAQYPFFDTSFFAMANGDLDYNLTKNLRNSGATKDQMKMWRKKGYV